MNIKNTVLVDLDGKNIKQQSRPGVEPGDDAPDLTVAKVLVNCALTPAQGQPYSPEKNAARYTTAVELHKADIGQGIDIANDLIVDLQKDVMRLYAPLVAGQLYSILEQKS